MNKYAIEVCAKKSPTAEVQKIGYNFKLQKPLNQRGGGTSLSSITTVLLSTKLEHYGTYIVLVFVFYFL